MMNRDYKRYANKVVSQIQANSRTKKRIREDIMEMLEERALDSRDASPEELMGSYEEVVEDFKENLNDYTLTSNGYVSSMSLWGLPLLYITTSQQITAKGIIAIGPRAVGIISIGGLSVGVISFGGLSLGVISLGGLALGLWAAIGGLALAYDVAIGGFAMASSLALGGFAKATDIAIGGGASAKLMGYTQNAITPNSLDEGNAFSYHLPVYMADFKAKLQFLFPELGPIKTWLLGLAK